MGKGTKKSERLFWEVIKEIRSIPKISLFEKYVEKYKEWFMENRWVYGAKLRAVKAMIPTSGRVVEIGVGTGRFAKPLGIKIDVEPSIRMREITQKQGIHVLGYEGERAK